jgi:RNA 2',3'-cyclic 3'-phosphodiesterase
VSREAAIRMFVALQLPEDVCERLALWAREAASASGLRLQGGSGGPLRLLAPQSLHLTLCFLGNRPAQELGAVRAALEACAEGVGELSVGAPLWLPRKRPRALAVELHDHAGEVGRLHDALARAISDATAWEPERRRFRPHITVARLRPGRRAAERSIAGQALPATPRLAFVPDAVTLYRSILDPGGASYEALASSRLLPSEL